MWTTHSAESAVHPIKRNGSAHVPAGTSQRAQRLNAIRNRSSRCADGPVEERAGLEHRVHDDGQFRATATAARLKPTRSLSLRPQFRRPLSAELRVRMTVAAS